MDGKKIEVLVVTGPTASGKSSLAVDLAERLGAHIISADSRQIYRGIPITTAAPESADLARVPHHLVQFMELDGYYSAASFEADASRIIEEASARGDRFVVVCGGSMMYVDALLYGLDDLPTISDAVRERVKQIYTDNGLEGIYALLDNLDPVGAKNVDANNPRRVMHAVELCLQTGRPASELLTGISGRPSRPFSYRKYVVRRSRDEMFDRINRRVDRMVKNGMEEEARSVYHLRHLNSLNTIGFKEWFAHFDGIMDRETAIARIAKNTRVYAKKQLTWLSKQTDITYLDPQKALNEILKDFDKKL